METYKKVDSVEKVGEQNKRKSNKPIYFSQKQVAEMILDYEERLKGTPEIARKFGVSTSTIVRTLVDAGIQMRKRGTKCQKGDGEMVDKVIHKSEDVMELKNQIASLDDDVQQIQESLEKETKQLNEALKEIQKMHIEAQAQKLEQDMHDKNRMYLVNANNELRAKVLELEEENAALRKILKKTL